MYSMFSTPLTCCSIGAATVSATTVAFAPGYEVDTRTVGGVICGYCAMGKSCDAIRPMRTMTMEITHAHTGRSIKKRAIRKVLLAVGVPPLGGKSLDCLYTLSCFPGCWPPKGGT